MSTLGDYMLELKVSWVEGRRLEPFAFVSVGMLGLEPRCSGERTNGHGHDARILCDGSLRHFRSQL